MERALGSFRNLARGLGFVSYFGEHAARDYWESDLTSEPILVPAGPTGGMHGSDVIGNIGEISRYKDVNTGLIIYLVDAPDSRSRL